MTLNKPFRKSSVRIQAELQYNKRTKEENRLRHQREIEHRNRMISFVSEWQDDGIQVAWKSNLKRIQETTREEILCANKELLLVRREGLRSLLAKDLATYEHELSLRDLAFHRNRI